MRTRLSLLAILTSFVIQAQTFTVTGTVKGVSSNEALPATTVLLFNAVNDSLLDYTVADENGHYQLSVTVDSFYLKAESMGYTEFTSTLLFSTKTNDFPILLEVNQNELDEVLILKKKKLIRLFGDKMIYDVEKSGLGEGNDGLDVIKRMPGIRTDKDDNLIFRGDNNLQILINGKPSLLGSQALKDYLKTLNGNDIKAIELISNPSAKYDASGTAGILNIKLKESYKSGLTGNVYGGLGYGDFWKNNQGANLYNQNGKWNFNAGVYRGYSKSVNNRRVIQTVTQSNETRRLEQFNDWFPISIWTSGKAGISYKATKNVSLGSSLNYSHSTSDETTLGLTKEWSNDSYERYTQLNNQEKSLSKVLTGNLYFNYESDSSDQKLDVQINFANYNKDVDRVTRNGYFNVLDDSKYRNDVVVEFKNPTQYKILSTRLDYEKQLKSLWSIETGLKYSLVDNDYDLLLNNQDTNGLLALDTGRSNHLLYEESIAAAYFMLNYGNDTWNVQAGLRGEYFDYKANSLTTNTTNSGDYLSIFPSFSINRSIENHQFKLGYSYRINRPRYLDLNPFFEYIDTYNVRVGNPNLQPQFSHSLELTWVGFDNTSISTYSNLASDVMYGIIDYDANTQITTLFQDNIASSNNVGLSVSSLVNVSSWWEIDLYGDLAFNQIISSIPQYSFNETGSNWYISATQMLTFKNNWSANVTAFYASDGRYGNSFDVASYDMTFSIKKLFLNKKLSLAFKARDIIKTNIYRGITTQDHVVTDWTNKWETRRFSLSLSYSFGSAKRKRVKRVDLSDEEGRL